MDSDSISLGSNPNTRKFTQKRRLESMNKKDEQLGMSFGTASNRLRKMVLFDLLKRHDENVCYRCEEIIDSCDSLSMEHKEAWLNVSVDLFWDLDNIAFSHMKCNISTPKPTKKIEGENYWCYQCKTFLSISSFGEDKTRWSGLRDVCKSCDVVRVQRYRSRRTITLNGEDRLTG